MPRTPNLYQLLYEIKVFRPKSTMASGHLLSLGMQVILEPRCLCGHGAKCLYYGKDVNALENFAPDRLPCSWCWAEGASCGRGGSCVAENCPVHFTKGKAVPWARLCAAMQARAIAVRPGAPWAMRGHLRSLHPRSFGDRDGSCRLHRPSHLTGGNEL